jgi:ribosomal protein L16 Arg81 hydroxylase
MTADLVEDVLRGLVGGMPLDDFNEQVRERQIAHFKAAVSADVLDNLFSLPRLERLLHEEQQLSTQIDIFDGTHLRQFVDQQRKPGQTNFDVVADYLRHGATIRVRSAERFDPQLGVLLKGIERCFVGRCDGNIYLTPPAKSGFPPHFDITDVFVVQLAGKKHWRIYDHYTNKSELPLSDAQWEPGRFDPLSPPREFELGRGDVLYLPRGVMHEAFCTARESMHLTISLASLTYADLLRKAIATAAAGNIELRRRVPSFAANDERETERLVQQAKERLVGLVTDSHLSGLLRQEHAVPIPNDAPTGSSPE